MKLSHEGQAIFQTPTVERYGDGNAFSSRLDRVLERVDQELSPPLLKLTGGEIFLIKGIMEFIEREASRHEAIIVQTNGLPLTDDRIDRLAKLGNLSIQISLDSSVFEGNSHRVRTPTIHDMVLKRVEAALKAGIQVEIYCVISERSAPYLCEFVEWCGQFRDNPPQLFPFPVRGPDAAKFRIQSGQIPMIENLLTMLEEFHHILPPRAYLERLCAFYRDGVRSWRCHLPRLVVSTFDDGSVTPCPNIWFHNLGNLDSDQWEAPLSVIGKTPFYDLLLAPVPRLAACKGCFTPWDTLSLYFNDDITIDELCRAPSYAPPGIRKLLEAKKSEYVQQAGN